MRRAIVISDQKSALESKLSPLSARSKKLIGAIVMLIWIPVYALIAMIFAIKILPHASGLAAFLYYAIAGTLWTLPIAAMLPWMNREPKTK